MSTTITTTRIDHTRLHSAKPSFAGLIRGEFLKISRRWMTWLFLLLLLGATTLVAFFRIVDPTSTKALIQVDKLAFLYGLVTETLSIFRAFSGIYLIILVAYVFGLEFQYGTIRVLLSRGVGRVQLLLAKLTTLLLISLLLLVVGTLYTALLTWLTILITTGNLDTFKVVTSDFWSNSGIYVLTILYNMAVTILMTSAICALTRSLAAGLTFAIMWFPVDNIATLFSSLGYRLNKNDFWLEITKYFLGPNLNQMGKVVLPAKVNAEALGTAPLKEITGSHTLWVAGVYGAIFLAVALYLTWKRDVKE